MSEYLNKEKIDVDNKNEEKMNKNDIILHLQNMLDILKSITIEKIFNKSIDIAKYETQLLSNINIKSKKPYIMDFDDFEKDEFYIYVLSVFHNVLHNYHNVNLKDIILKNLIDLINIFNLIIQNNNNYYHDNDFRFYLYHVLNAFQPGVNKIEQNSHFFKYGIEILLKKYKILNFNEFYPEHEAEKIKLNYINFLRELLNKVKKEYINKTLTCPNEDYSKEFDDISKIVKELDKEKIKKDNNIFIANIKNCSHKILILIMNLYANNKYLYYVSILLYEIEDYIPSNINEFFYVNYIHLKNDIDNYINQINESTLNNIRKSQFYNENLIQKLIEYYIKFYKYNNIKNILNDENGENSVKNIFKEMIKDKTFREKVINLYKSEKMKKFIYLFVDKDERDKLLKYLDNFIILLEKDTFWDKIMFYPLSKYKKAYVANYVRIIINDNYITFKIFNLKEKYLLLKFILFELIIHELMYLLRRLTLSGVCSELSLTPPNEDDKKKEDLSGEIGERLIKFFFNVNKIQRIILDQAEFFDKLHLKTEEEIGKLEHIFEIESKKKEKEISYAKFCKNQNNREVIFETHDCRKFIYISKFEY